MISLLLSDKIKDYRIIHIGKSIKLESEGVIYYMTISLFNKVHNKNIICYEVFDKEHNVNWIQTLTKF